uniref:Uncharacterized protein n=1 Tax=Arundo donax TaxID=35708 RepID=A0A0A9G4W3_ARUDO
MQMLIVYVTRERPNLQPTFQQTEKENPSMRYHHSLV